ncbi:MAG: biopolymer transporter ExbD [Bacteroidetes bacterium]|nr:MAG: biopolymer transporter ExbD [Bacteroidota bacterium]
MAKKKRENPEISTGSMADIAFLLLIFFLVTTTIASDKGLSVRLPPKQDVKDKVDIKERNIFKVLVNSTNHLLVQEQPMELKNLKEEAKKFILNNGADPLSSEDPEKAVISFKTDRGTNYEIYIKVMDELKKAYTEVRAQKMGVTPDQFLAFENDPDYKNEKFDDVKKAIPLNLSEAEPTGVGN